MNDAIWQWNQAEINYKNNMKFAKENPLIIKAKWFAERQYERDKDYALKLLGEGLHALQDVDAHGQIGVDDVIASHVGLKGIDDPNYDWADSSQTSVVKSTEQKRYNNTKNNTIDYLKRFIEGIS